MKNSWVALFALCCASTWAEDWFPYKVESTVPAFSNQGQKVELNYVPLAKASKKWNVCVSFPHMKDAYWLGVDYGVTQEARRQGIALKVFEAGGYDQLKHQIAQIESCVAAGAQAVVIGAISGDGLNGLIGTLNAKHIPVIDVINGIYSQNLTAKSLVSFYGMGQTAGAYLAKSNPVNNRMKVGWFPGPLGAAWAEAAHSGFMAAIAQSGLDVLPPQHGDTGLEAQTKLIEATLAAHPDVAYLVGTAVTAEAAVAVLRKHKLERRVKVLAFYLTPGVYAGIKSGQIVAAPADSMVIQGRVAIDQAVRALEKQSLSRHVGPKIFMVDSQSIGQVKLDDILPPPSFKAVFSVP